MGSCQANFVKSGNGYLDGSQAALTCKPVILFVVIAAAVIVLELFLLFVLLPSQRVVEAIQVKPSESCHLMLTQD